MSDDLTQELLAAARGIDEAREMLVSSEGAEYADMNFDDATATLRAVLAKFKVEKPSVIVKTLDPETLDLTITKEQEELFDEMVDADQLCLVSGTFQEEPVAFICMYLNTTMGPAMKPVGILLPETYMTKHHSEMKNHLEANPIHTSELEGPVTSGSKAKN